MTRGLFRSLALVCTLALAACVDTGSTITDISPSYDHRATDPPKDFTTILSGQLQLPAGALPIAYQWIGPEGGHVQLNGRVKDGQPTFHRVDVPAGAVKERTLFVIQLASRTHIDVDLFAYRINERGRMTDVGHLGFQKPVQLTMSYAWASGTVDPSRLGIVYMVGNRVKERMPAQANAAARKVVGQLRHFSRYAVDAD